MKIISKTQTESLLYPMQPDSFCCCIDTTGYHPETSAITMIGIVFYENNRRILKQYFNETGFEQKEILSAFLEDIKNMTTVYTYYGNRFTLAFLMSKCEEFGFPHPFASMESVDLYEIIQPFRYVLGLTSCKQTVVETFYQCSRTTISGKKLVTAYQKFVSDPQTTVHDLFFLHNEESLQNLCTILVIQSLNDIKKGNLLQCHLISRSDTVISIGFRFPHNTRLSVLFENEWLSLSIQEQVGVLSIPVYENHCIRHYFPDVKNYYYLPSEDRAVHKSMASFIAKELRTKANIHTCYDYLSCDHPALNSPDALKSLISDTISHLLLCKKQIT